MCGSDYDPVVEAEQVAGCRRVYHRPLAGWHVSESQVNDLTADRPDLDSESECL
jgi:hypothetical protein